MPVVDLATTLRDITIVTLSVLGGIGSIFVLHSVWHDNKIERAVKYPKGISGPISYTRLHREIHKIRRENENIRPDVIASVHYGGMPVASKFAKAFGADLILVHTEVEKVPTQRKPLCKSASCDDRQRIDGKYVWIVDNHIWSGRTMQLAKKAIVDAGAKAVYTVAVHRNGNGVHIDTVHPDLIMFRSKRELRKLIS